MTANRRNTRRNRSLFAPALFAALLWTVAQAGTPLPAAADFDQDEEAAAATAEDEAAAAEDATAEDEAAADAEEPETYDNKIRWATASEVDNFGFDVFRGESEDGPFERLNSQVIEGAGTTDEPQRYEFVDDTIDPRKAYYYYVESISMSGEREQFTPVGRAKPKIAPEEDEGAEEEEQEAPSAEEEKAADSGA